MVYLPPVPPQPLAYLNVASYAAAECEKGSRNCFPEDRVGGWRIESVTSLKPQWSTPFAD